MTINKTTMNKLTNFWRSSLQVSTCGAIALILACSVSIDSESVTPSQALIDRLPFGATTIAWIDFEALNEAIPLEQWERYEGMFLGVAAVRQAEEAIGIDLREDLRQIGVAVMPVVGGIDYDEPIVLISADFDRDRFESLLTDVMSIEYAGATMCKVDDFVRNLMVAADLTEDFASLGIEAELEIESANDAYMVVLDDTTLAIGTEESLRTVIDVEGGRREPLESDPTMKNLISEVATQGQVWLVATKPLIPTQLGSDDAPLILPSTIGNLEAISMSVQMGDGLSARFAGIATSSEETRMLTDSLNGLIAMGKMMSQGSQPELFEILDGVHAERDEREINIEVNLSQASLDFLLSIAVAELGNMTISFRP